MKSEGTLRDAKEALRKAMKALRSGAPTGDNVQTALKWLEAAWESKPTENEKEEIHHLTCLTQCANNDFDAARGTFKKANSGRDISPTWQELGIIIYTKMTISSDLKVALEECNQAISWFVDSDQNSNMMLLKAILYGRKAFCHLKLGQYADTVACCNIASRLLPEHLAPLRIMAEIMMRQGDHGAATEYLSLAIANRP